MAVCPAKREEMSPTPQDVKDFLNPKSILTPGIAGGISMVISNTLWMNFGLTPRWSGLVISFLLGLLVLATVEIVLWQKGIYWVLNSLIIFSVGAGTNTVGARATGHLEALLSPSGISIAYAEGAQETRKKESQTPTEPGLIILARGDAVPQILRVLDSRQVKYSVRPASSTRLIVAHLPETLSIKTGKGASGFGVGPLGG